MPLDGITAKCLAAELNTALAEARLDRITQPDRHEIILLLRKDNKNLRLILSANPAAPRVHLTTEQRENPTEPPMFCMLLRKHLAGARLIDVTTPGYERIFQFRFLTINELGDRLEKRLVVEIMGRHSNIILLNHENRIHDAIQHVDESISRVREVMPARVYVLPPDQKKRTPEETLQLLRNQQSWLDPAAGNKALDKAILESLQGFSPQLCQEVVERSGLDRRLHAVQLDAHQLDRLSKSLESVLTISLAGPFSPTTFYDQPDGLIPIDFHALPLSIYAYSQPETDVSAAMDRFYLERSRQNRLQQKRQSLDKVLHNYLEHAEKKLLIHEQDRLEGENSELYRRYGEMILANLHNWVDGQTTLSAIDYYDAEQATIEIPLETGKTAAQNAQRYFKQYGKAKTKYETGSRLATEDAAEIEWLESVRNNLSSAVDLADIEAVRQELDSSGLTTSRTRFPRREGDGTGSKRGEKVSATPSWLIDQPGKPGARSKRRQQAAASNLAANKKAARKKEKQPAALPPRQFTSSDGLTFLVGRNNLQNDQLTLKTAQKDDVWLHVQKIPGTHVIIRANKKTVPDQTLQEAAETAAWFSRANAAMSTAIAGGHKVAVDYCPVSHVKKPAGARPGMVIYDKYQTLLVAPKDPKDLTKAALTADPDPSESSL